MWYEITHGLSEPVTLAEAKEQLRVDHTEEDALISNLISAARAKVEAETGRVLLDATVTSYWDEWPDNGRLDLPLYPARSVTSVSYLDDDGTLTVWPSDNYTVFLTGISPRIWPNPDVITPETGDYPGAIQVVYTAGAATVGEVPAELKQAILSLVAFLYERREDTTINPGVRSAAWLAFSSRSNLI